MSFGFAAGGFSWFKLLGLPTEQEMPSVVLFGFEVGGKFALDPLYHSILAVVILTGLALLAKQALVTRARGPEGLIPDDKLSPRTFFELFTEGFMGFLDPMLHKDSKVHFPLLATLFLYIMVCNVLGLIPGFQPSTAMISTNIGMALVVFLAYNLAGIKAHGFVNHMKHFAGPVWWLAWLMIPIEIVSHIARPASLSVRLYGNMHGDHIVLDTFLHLSRGILIPVLFLALGLFVCLLQAFVFSLLSTVYISLSVAHEEEGAH